MALALKHNPDVNMPQWNRVAQMALKWLWRLGAVVLAVFWGAFLVEHVQEWYAYPKHDYPPLWVGLSMACHAGMVLGLLGMVFWERLGSLAVVLCTAGFILIIAGNGRGFVGLPLVNLVPVGLVVASWLLRTPGFRRV